MNALVKRGLELMREPDRVQGFHYLKDDNGNLCALGCVAQAAVESGCAVWVSKGTSFYLAQPGATVETPLDQIDIPDCVNAAYQDMRDHGIMTLDITSMNDNGEKTLPEIADAIESCYAKDAVPA